MDDDNAVVFAGEFVADRSAVVRGAVIDKNDLDVFVGLC